MKVAGLGKRTGVGMICCSCSFAESRRVVSRERERATIATWAVCQRAACPRLVVVPGKIAAEKVKINKSSIDFFLRGSPSLPLFWPSLFWPSSFLSARNNDVQSARKADEPRRDPGGHPSRPPRHLKLKLIITILSSPFCGPCRRCRQQPPGGLRRWPIGEGGAGDVGAGGVRPSRRGDSPLLLPRAPFGGR